MSIGYLLGGAISAHILYHGGKRIYKRIKPKKKKGGCRKWDIRF